MGQRTVLLSLSEPRASQQATWLAGHGFEVLNASTHRLQAIPTNEADWHWTAALRADRDVLVPTSPGAVGCLAIGLEEAGLKRRLEAMAWLCLGEGSFEAIQNHFPALSDRVEAVDAWPRLARLEHRDLNHLLDDPASRAWIGQRTVHLLCARHRVAALEAAHKPSWATQLAVHAIYQDDWQDLPPSQCLNLLQALASANQLVWHIGSIALLEQAHRALSGDALNGLAMAAQSLARLEQGRARLGQAKLLAPHQRIIDRARQLGYKGPGSIAAGSQAVLDRLSFG